MAGLVKGRTVSGQAVNAFIVNAKVVGFDDEGPGDEFLITSASFTIVSETEVQITVRTSHPGTVTVDLDNGGGSYGPSPSGTNHVFAISGLTTFLEYTATINADPDDIQQSPAPPAQLSFTCHPALDIRCKHFDPATGVRTPTLRVESNVQADLSLTFAGVQSNHALVIGPNDIPIPQLAVDVLITDGMAIATETYNVRQSQSVAVPYYATGYLLSYDLFDAPNGTPLAGRVTLPTSEVWIETWGAGANEIQDGHAVRQTKVNNFVGALSTIEADVSSVVIVADQRQFGPDSGGVFIAAKGSGATLSGVQVYLDWTTNIATVRELINEVWTTLYESPPLSLTFPNTARIAVSVRTDGLVIVVEGHQSPLIDWVQFIDPSKQFGLNNLGDASNSQFESFYIHGGVNDNQISMAFDNAGTQTLMAYENAGTVTVFGYIREIP